MSGPQVFYGSHDPSWEAKDISPYAYKLREKLLAIENMRKEEMHITQEEELESLPEAEPNVSYRTVSDERVRKLKILLQIFEMEPSFQEQDYPPYLLPFLAELVTYAETFRFSQEVSVEKYNQLLLTIVREPTTSTRFVGEVFRQLDPGEEAEHLTNILFFESEFVRAFLRTAQHRLSLEEANALGKKAVSTEAYSILILLTSMFPELNPEYAISVSGEGEVSNIDQIFSELSKYIDGKSTIINCYLTSVEDPIELIRSGLLPHPGIQTIFLPGNEEGYASFYEVEFVVSLLAQEVPIEQIEWWTNLQNVEEALRHVKLWSFYTKEGALQEAQRGSSYASLFAYPDLLYSNLRPRTGMMMFQLPRSLTLARLPAKHGKLLPVTRYATGMSRGMYFTERHAEQEEFCGTFYYLEPESSTYLQYNTSHVSFSKYTAYEELKQKYRELTGSDPEELMLVREHEKREEESKKYAYLNRGYLAYQLGLLHQDLRYTPSEYLELVKRGIISSSCFSHKKPLEKNRFSEKEVPIYIGSCPELGLYSTENMLNQPLCTLGKVLGIDLIILEYMVGSHQIVTEVLDTRHRETSFRNLVFS